jgi:hypothetical protein
MKAWAEELGYSDAAELLEATLEEEKATDEALSALAESVINIQAEGAEPPPSFRMQFDNPARGNPPLPGARNDLVPSAALLYWPLSRNFPRLLKLPARQALDSRNQA